MNRKTKSWLVTAVSIALVGVQFQAASKVAAQGGGDRKYFLPVTFKDNPVQVTSFGIHYEPVKNPAGVDVIGKIGSSGSTWTRVQPGLLWKDIEAVEGTYDWSKAAALEEQLRFFASKNIKVLLWIQHTPEWAQRFSNQFCGPVKPEKFGRMNAFFVEAVKRYSAAPYNVEYFEFYNEPDAAFKTPGTPNYEVFGCWGNSSDATYGGRDYGLALKSVHDAVKAAVPSAKVLVGGLLMDCLPQFRAGCNEAKFIDGMLDGAGASFDGISFHGYDVVNGVTPLGRYGWPGYGSTQDAGPVLVTKARYLRERMAAKNITGKFLMNTEVGIVVFGGTSAGIFPQPERELTKAYYVAQAYSAGIHEDLKANVWFEINGWNGSGLIKTDGSDALAFTAFRHALKTLGNASRLSVVSSADLGGVPNVLGYKLNRNGKQVWVVWSRDGVARTATLAQTPANVTDALGVAVSKTAIPISVNPVYIEF
jgi:hypothetical protein